MPDPVIEMRDVTFRWRQQDPVVLDVADLTIFPREKVFVSGPSGSGKTTLLNLLGGVAVPQKGSVRILGTNITAMQGSRRDAFRADHIGFIFQMFNLVPYLTMIENVLLPCRFSRARRSRTLSRSPTPEEDAQRLLKRMKIDVERLAALPVLRLSTGQQQRVAAARSLIGSPDVVIADEPTSALDADARRSFLDLLFQETAEVGATLVYVSHDTGLTAGFDRVLSLPDINRADLNGLAA